MVKNYSRQPCGDIGREIMWKRMCAILALAMALASPALQAENLVIPLGNQGGETSQPMPEQGMLKPAVRQLLGNPVREQPPVGNPPISVWEYPEFKVFFEHDHVVHVVKKHHPAHPEGID
jgi:hypothetical protein